MLLKHCWLSSLVPRWQTDAAGLIKHSQWKVFTAIKVTLKLRVIFTVVCFFWKLVIAIFYSTAFPHILTDSIALLVLIYTSSTFSPTFLSSGILCRNAYRDSSGIHHLDDGRRGEFFRDLWLQVNSRAYRMTMRAAWFITEPSDFWLQSFPLFFIPEQGLSFWKHYFSKPSLSGITSAHVIKYKAQMDLNVQ